MTRAALGTGPAVSASARSRTATAAIVLVAWVVILGAVLAIGWLLTHPLESTVDPWDDDAARWFAGERTQDLNGVADAGTFLGETIVGMGVAAVVAVALSWWRRSFVPAIVVGLLVAGIGGFYWVATQLISRDRPPVRILDPGLVPDHSYPSGHVATATAVYGGLAVLLWVLAPAARRWVWPLFLLPLFVALARLYQGAHHITDELASFAYTTAWLATLVAVVLTRDRPVSTER
jgi:membrane-associated phospholipid phosphatase